MNGQLLRREKLVNWGRKTPRESKSVGGGGHGGRARASAGAVDAAKGGREVTAMPKEIITRAVNY